MLYLNLFKEFFKIGIFSFGGGYATIPFLMHITKLYNWYTIGELKQMIVIASITPGPIGINMATYAGIKTGGLITALIATLSIVLPAILLVVLLSKIFHRYKDNFYIQSAVYGLKPVCCALITGVCIKLIKSSVNSIYDVIIFVLLFTILIKYKKTPIFYLTVSGLRGLFLYIITQTKA